MPYRVINSTKGGGSTDVGDVSWRFLLLGLEQQLMSRYTWHSWQAASCTGTTIGFKGMINAAKTLALSTKHLLENPSDIEKAKIEFEDKRGKDYIYQALVGDREPALNYRN